MALGGVNYRPLGCLSFFSPVSVKHARHHIASYRIWTMILSILAQFAASETRCLELGSSRGRNKLGYIIETLGCPRMLVNGDQINGLFHLLIHGLWYIYIYILRLQPQLTNHYDPNFRPTGHPSGRKFSSQVGCLFHEFFLVGRF